MKRRLCLLLALSVVLLCGCAPPKEKPVQPDPAEVPAEKPVIYIYPEEEVCDEKPVVYCYPEQALDVTVTLDLDGQLTTSYPRYENGWCVTALPDGTLTDAHGRQYPYLFWEGVLDMEYDLSQGWCVKGSETEAFLEKTLPLLGLNDLEAAEFITYWLPRMEGSAWNRITFQQENYMQAARLTVVPEPDTLIRICMAWQSLEAPVPMEVPTLPTITRQGFTVVEWGGIELK